MSPNSENLRHWNALSKTDPKHTKEFQRAGGFRGTAIKPIYAYQKMTEHFGPCGLGWGMDKPEFEVVEAAGETLVFCTLPVWYALTENAQCYIFGVGGDKVTSKRKDGTVVADDEAFKKAYTDALTNALVKIGVSADVHMGMFEDNKYVSALKKEFAEEPASPPSPKPEAVPTADQLKAQAEALAKKLKEASNVFKLDQIMDDNRPLLGKLPQKTYDYLGKLYEDRKTAMETAA